MAGSATPHRRWIKFTTEMLLFVLVAGCGAGAPVDPWIHPGKCVIVNESPTAIGDVYLITDNPPWETVHIAALDPGETGEIALPGNRIPISEANLVFVNWDEDKNSHISAHVNVVDLVGQHYQGDLRFLIRRKSASVEQAAPVQ